jgi:transketolase
MKQKRFTEQQIIIIEQIESLLGANVISQTFLSSQRIRKIILEQSYRAHVGHIGSALSIADIIAALYSTILKIESPNDPDRDRFILAKGHSALALYAALYLRGWITDEVLNSFCCDGTFLGVHPEHKMPGIDFSTGSLGQGLSYGVGSALAAIMENSSRRVFVLLSDAECNEGSVWEAIMFAAHHKLANLIAIVDLNGQQAMGYSQDILNMSPMTERWQAFGWDVHDLDGHDKAGIERVIADLDTSSGLPHVLIARTTAGKGVSFMERQIKWHYWPLSTEEYQQAIVDIGNDQ